MKKFTSFILFSFLVLASCSAQDKPIKTTDGKTQRFVMAERVFKGEVSPIKTRLDVYNSMARAVKYNVDNAVEIMGEKLYSTTNPVNTVKDILNAQSSDGSSLYRSMKALDFAIAYAAVSLGEDRNYLDNSLYVRASQNLALGSIKSHKDALFAMKKNKEIDRMISREHKNLKILNDKLERAGSLSEEDLAYKKDLDVFLLRMSEMQKMFNASIMNHAKIIKADNPHKLELEGRKFYELDDFDKSLSVGVFQRSAFAHRDEFLLAREMGKIYSFDDIESNVLKKYPEIERLKVNGFSYDSPLYLPDLEKRTQKVAYNLIDKVVKFARTPPLNDERPLLKQEAFEELSVAIFAQIEAAYSIVKNADLDLREVTENVSRLKKDIAVLERENKTLYENKSSLLNKRFDLMNEELRASEVLGERALAIRSLYFNAGLSPFTQSTLRSETKEIANRLKVAFNKDVIEMLALAKKEYKGEDFDPMALEIEGDDINNEWAKNEGWLETMLSDKSAESLIEREERLALVKPDAEPIGTYSYQTPYERGGKFEPYMGAEHDKKRTLQLGSYAKRESADIEWSMLTALYPELMNFTPKIEKTKVDGKVFYRMVIHSAEGGLTDLCNRMRADKMECLLR